MPSEKGRTMDTHENDTLSGAGSYCRYSSHQQEERSITDQQRKCRSAAASREYAMDGSLEFADEAVSGAKRDRAGFEAMMRAARSRRIRVLYVENLSRLARDSVLTMGT